MSSNPQLVHCPQAQDCGACAFLDFDYGNQLRRKEQLLEQAMERQRGRIGHKLLPCMPSPQISGYRNRARMAVGISRHGPIRVGYFREHSREIVDAINCRVLIPELLETTRAFRRLLDVKTKAFPRQLRHIDLRCGTDPRRQHLILVIRDDKAPRLPLADIRQACPDVDGISINLNPSSGPQVLKGQIEPLWGAREIFVESSGMHLRVSPGAFFQVNLDLLPEIHELMADFLGTGDCLADLYSGVGTHGFALRDQFRRTLFIEGVRAAVADIKAIAQHYSVGQTQIVAKPVERALKPLLAANADAVVMNPSRAGASPEVLETLGSSAAQRIAYLSCDPRTLARDVGSLVQMGFELVSVQPIDMMPQTRHVEALALLARRKQRR